ncbi:MAG: hypothetical protein LBV16_02665 [Elusimicrobiota bacterium]|jgi:hypothetical protein|nr:hypothetical protein [Elusimicrobiota bacterium]
MEKLGSFNNKSLWQILQNASYEGTLGAILGGAAGLGIGKAAKDGQTQQDKAKKETIEKSAVKASIDIMEGKKTKEQIFTELQKEYARTGLDEKTAQEVAVKVMDRAAQPEIQKSIQRLVEKEMSPINDIGNSPQEVAAKTQELIKENRAKAQILNNKQRYDLNIILNENMDKFEAQGMPKDEAKMTALLIQNAAINAINSGIAKSPQEYFEKRQIKVIDERQNQDGQQKVDTAKNDIHFQSAMYRNKAQTIGGFSEFVRNNQENNLERNKSYFDFKAPKSNLQIDLDFSDMYHINEKHKLNEAQLNAIVENIENIETAYTGIGNNQHSGKTVLAKINTPLGKAGIVLEFIDNGRIFLDTAFFDSETNIDNWVEGGKKKGASGILNIGANAPSPVTTSYTPIRSIKQKLGIVNEYNPNKYYQSAIETTGADLNNPTQVQDAIKEWKEKGTESNYFKKWFKDSKVVDENGKPLVVYHATGETDISIFSKENGAMNTDYENPPAWLSSVMGFWFNSNGKRVAAKTHSGIIMPVYLNISNPAIYSDLHTFWAYLESMVKDNFDFENYLNIYIENNRAGLEKKYGKTHIKNILSNEMDEEDNYFKDQILREEKQYIPLSEIVSFYQENGTDLPVLMRNLYDEFDGIIITEDNEFGGTSYVAFAPSQIKSVSNRGTFDENNPDIYYQSAYHGSPYLFDEFSTEHIGSGDGNQVFGWGIYTAQEKETGIKYAKELQERKRNEKFLFIHQREPAGLYKVDIPESDVMLDWYKSLSEQPQKVKKELFDILKEAIDIIFNKYNHSIYTTENSYSDSWTGEQFYKRLSEIVDGQKAASLLLNKHGIEGIQYYTNGRFNIGKATPNFVVFNDKAIKILDREVYYQSGIDKKQQKNFENKIEDIIANKKSGEKISLGQIPQLYVEQIGMTNNTLQINGKAILKANGIIKSSKGNRHSVLKEDIKNLLSLINNPLAVYEEYKKNQNTGKKQRKIGAILDAKDKEGKQVVAIISPNENKGAGYHFIPTILGKGRLENLLKSKKLLWQKKAPDLSRGNQFPPQVSQEHVWNISQNPNDVKYTQDDQTNYANIARAAKAKRDEIRGSTEFTREGAIVRIFKNGDASTIIHEMAGHIYLRDIEDTFIYASNPANNYELPSDLIAMKRDLDIFLGTPQGGNGRYSVDQHELFAKAAEAYIMEGKAPNARLKRIFEHFRQWLLDIYHDIEDLVKLTPEARRVFDKLFAPEHIETQTKTQGKTKEVAEVIKKAKVGEKVKIAGISLNEVRDLLLTINQRAPQLPKTHLLTDLRRLGYVKGNQEIDEEAKEQGVKAKPQGVGALEEDTAAEWLRDLGYISGESQMSNEDAYAMIRQALRGETIYKMDDMDRINDREAYFNNLDQIRELFDGNIDEAEDILKMITQAYLSNRDLRVVEKSDIEFLENKIEKMNNLVEQTKKGAQAIKEKNAALKAEMDEIMGGVEDIEFEGKDEIMQDFEKAANKTEALIAIDKALEKLNKEFENTAAGREEKEKLALPKTNYEKIKSEILKKAKDIVENGRKTKKSVIYDENGIREAARTAIDGIRHLPSKDKGKFIGMLNSIRSWMDLVEKVDALLTRAKSIEESNYSRQVWELIYKQLKMPVFVKQGAVKTGRYDYESNVLFAKLQETIRGTKEEAAKNLSLRLAKEEPFTFTEIMENKVLSIRAQGAGNTSPQMMKSLYDEITGLRENGRKSKTLIDIEKEFNREKDAQEMIKYVNKHKKINPLTKGYLEYVANFESTINALFGKSSIDRYSLLKKESDAYTFAWHNRQEVFNEAKKSYGVASDFDISKKWAENLKEEYEFLNNFDGQNKIEKINKAQLITMYIYLKNPVLKERLYSQYGAVAIDEMLAKLDDGDIKFGDYLQKKADSYYEAVNKVFVKTKGIDLPKMENYFPSKTERITSDIDLLADRVANSKNPSFIKSRAGVNVQMKLGDPIKILFNHIQDVSDYIYKQEALNDLRRIFRNPLLKNAVENKHGEDAYYMLLDKIDNSTLGKRKDRNYTLSKIGNHLTNMYVKSAIALKPTIAVKQLLSTFNYAENMPAEKWAQYYLSGIANWKETIKFMQQDEYLKARFNEGAQNEAFEAVMRDDFFKNRFMGKVSNLLMLNVRLGDLGANLFGGYPYVKYLMQEQGLSKEEAFDKYNEATHRSQQSNLPSSKSNIQNKDMYWWSRALFAFRNTGFQYTRKMADSIIAYSRGEITGKQMSKTLMIYAVLNPFLYTLVSNLAIVKWITGDDDDDHETYDLIASVFEAPFMAIPLIDEAIHIAVKHIVTGKGNLRGDKMPIISDVYKVFNGFLDEDGIEIEDWIKFGKEAGKLITGIPFDTLQSMAYQATMDIKDGNYFKGILEYAGYTQHRAEKITGD